MCSGGIIKLQWMIKRNDNSNLQIIIMNSANTYHGEKNEVEMQAVGTKNQQFIIVY